LNSLGCTSLRHRAGLGFVTAGFLEILFLNGFRISVRRAGGASTGIGKLMTVNQIQL